MDKQFIGVGGIQPEVEPIRTYDYERAFGTNLEENNFPSYYILPKDRIGIIKNQGSVGACVGCVMSSLTEVFEKIEAEKDGRNLSDEDVEFSEGWAYGALREAKDNYYGMYTSLALEQWRKKGIVPKKYFNFLEEMPLMRQRVDAFPELYKIAERYRIKSYVSINYANREKRDLAIKEAIYNRKYGLLAASTDYFGEGHCIMLIGWDDKNDRYIFKNSWGEKWSGDGIGEIPKREVNYIYVITDEELELPFTDVKTDEWYFGDVKNVYLGNLMNGISDTEFGPLNNITRAEFATLLGRLVKMVNDRLENIVNILKIKYKKSDSFYNSELYLIQKTRTDKMLFEDVFEEAWYYDDVVAAYEYGLINGKSEKTFDPEGNITRAEIATLIVRIYNLFIQKLNYILAKTNKKKITLVENDCEFTDVFEKDWFYSAVKTIFNLGIMSGKGNNCFEPNSFTTRAEVAAIINRLSKYIDSKNYIAVQ